MKYYRRFRNGTAFYIDETGAEVDEKTALTNLQEAPAAKNVLHESRKSHEQLLIEKDAEIARLRKIVPAEQRTPPSVTRKSLKESAAAMLPEGEAEIFANPEKYMSRVER